VSGGPDCRAAIQAAIDAAAVVGHNRVVIPRGEWHISGSISLQSHTKLMGVAHRYSNLRQTPSWAPTSGFPAFIETPQDAQGTGSLGFLGCDVVMTVGAVNTFRWSLYKWGLGRKSHTFAASYTWDWIPPTTLEPARYGFQFDGPTCGGRHYGLEGNGRGYNGKDTRVVKVNGTRQALHLYGMQTEIQKGAGTAGNPDANTEIVDSSNVRVYMTKREGTASTLLCTNSDNVAWYGGAAMRGTLADSTGAASHYYHFNGGSTNLLVACALTQSTQNDVSGTNMIYEDTSVGGGAAHAILWPSGCSVYKRGTIDDSFMAID
jgi:hypothetical protein